MIYVSLRVCRVLVCCLCVVVRACACCVAHRRLRLFSYCSFGFKCSAAMVLPDEAALLGECASQQRLESGERRTKLYRYDHVSSMVFDPFGVSTIKDASVVDLWAFVKRGNKKVAFYSEFASSDPGRRGVAISRLAQVLQCALDQLSSDANQKFIEKKVYQKIAKEMNSMKPWVKTLNMGRRPSTSMRAGLSSAGKDQLEDGDYVAAVKELYAWLELETSSVRPALSLLSCGGVFYAASSAEKVGRSAIHAKGGGLCQEDFEAAITARASEHASESGGKDTAMAKAEADLLK